MTLFLQSDKAIKLPKLSSKVLGAKLEIDFRDGTNKLNGALVDLNTLIEKTNKGRGGKIDAYGIWTETLDYELGVSVDQRTFNRGLIVEQSYTNLFLNSKAPVTQTISVTITAATEALILSAAGNGIVEAKIGGLLLGKASNQNPVVIHGSKLGLGTHSIEIIVTGALSYVGLYRSVQMVERVSRLTTLGTTAALADTVIRIKPSVINSLIASWTGCIVIKNYVPQDIFDRTKNTAQSGSILQVKNAEGKGYFVARQENGPLTNILRRFDMTEKIEQTNTPVSNSNIYALNFSPTSAKLAHNGSLSNEVTTTGVTFSDIFVGSGNSWSTTITNYVQEILLFDRQLTDEELISITS